MKGKKSNEKSHRNLAMQEYKKKNLIFFLQKPTKGDDLGSGWVSLEILFSDGDIRDTESEIRASSSAGSDGSRSFFAR